MKITRFLFLCISAFTLIYSAVSCSKEEPKKNEPIGVVNINGVERVVLQAGYIDFDSPSPQTTIQLVVDDPDGPSGRSNIEILVPVYRTGTWYTLCGDEADFWRITFRNQVGTSSSMGIFADGTVLSKPINNLDETDKRQCQVAFHITQTDGTVISANFTGQFENNLLWISGK